MTLLSEQLSVCGSFHQHRINQWLYMLGILMMVLSLMISMSWIHVIFFLSGTCGFLGCYFLCVSALLILECARGWRNVISVFAA